MRKITALLLILSAINVFCGDAKKVYIGIKDYYYSEYNSTTIQNITFRAWLEKSAGPEITLGDTLDQNSPGSSCAMISYRGRIGLDLQNFDTWGIGNNLKVRIFDENNSLKVCHYLQTEWEIDDDSSVDKLIGFEPLLSGSGLAISMQYFYDCETVSDCGCNQPETTTLYQNYPNPFNPVAQISFSISKTTSVRLNVYNTNGQLVSELASGVKKAGHHTVDFDGSMLNSGVYYYTLEVDGKSLTKKMLLVK